MLFLFNQLWVIRDNILVAKKAFLHDWKTGVLGSVHKGMAETAVDLLDAGMHPMAEVDGLLGTDVLLGV